jgi:hypothetical protein
MLLMIDKRHLSKYRPSIAKKKRINAAVFGHIVPLDPIRFDLSPRKSGYNLGYKTGVENYATNRRAR